MNSDVYTIFESYKKVFAVLNKKTKTIKFLELHEELSKITDKNYNDCCLHLEGGKTGYLNLIAIKLEALDFVIDVEDKKGDGVGKQFFEKLKKQYLLEESLTTTSKSGGVHVHYRLSDASVCEELKLKLKDYLDIEFLKNKRLVFISDSERLIKITNPSSMKTLDINSPIIKDLRGSNVKKIDLNNNKKTKRNIGQIIFPEFEFLNHLKLLLKDYSPDAEHDEWFVLMCRVFYLCEMLAHNKLANKCFNVFNEWSAQTTIENKYNENDLLRKWKSINPEAQNKAIFSGQEHIKALQQQYTAVKLNTKNVVIFNNFNQTTSYPQSLFTKIWGVLSKKIKFISLVVAQQAIYDPTTSNVLIEKDESLYFNLFNKKTIPKKLTFDSFGNEEQSFIKAILAWIDVLAGKDSIIILNFIAFLLQKFGQRSQIAIILKSEIKGVGKSTLAGIIRVLLHKRNCNIVSNDAMESQFTSYTGDNVFTYWDEFVFLARTAEKMIAKLNRMVTESEVNQHKKGIDETVVDNFGNIMMSTNSLKNFPFSNKGRRWVLIDIDYPSKEEFRKKLEDKIKKYGFTCDSFFKKLNQFKENQLDESYRLCFAGYLYEFPLNLDYFKGDAPVTDALKKAIIETSEAMEGFTEIETLLEHGGLYYNEKIAVTQDIKNALGDTLSDHKITTILTRLGYKNTRKFSCVYNTEKIRRRIWAKDLSTEKIKNEINNLLIKYK